MPGFNQSGPEELGPMTGWGRGMCTKERSVYGRGVAGNAGLGRNRGLGRGFRGRFRSDMPGYPGRGLGYRWNAGMSLNPEDANTEIDAFKAQAESMQRTLDALNSRITEMENN